MRLAEADAAIDHLRRACDDKQRIPIFLDLGVLVGALGVLDGERMQTELFLHADEQVMLRFVKSDPNHMAGTARPRPGIVYGNVDELSA